jgi:hypothetical protein
LDEKVMNIEKGLKEILIQMIQSNDKEEEKKEARRDDNKKVKGNREKIQVMMKMMIQITQFET